MRLLLLSGILILNVVTIAANDSLIDASNAIYSRIKSYGGYQPRYVMHKLNTFSEKFFKVLAKNVSNDLLISPIGVGLSLSMSAGAAHGDSEIALGRTLELDLYEIDRRSAFQSLIDHSNIHGSIRLRVANSLFAAQGIDLHPKYIASCKRAFRSSLQYVDFNKPGETSAAINELCAKQTNSRITEIFNADDIRESTSKSQIVVVNTIHFKGAWSKKFNVSSTKETFRSANGRTTSVTYMSGNHTVLFGEYPEVNATFIQLPFLSDNDENSGSMFILLPNDINGLAYLEKNFHEIHVEDLHIRGKNRTVNIRLPQLKIENEFELDEPLTRMNMSNLIDRRSGEFQPLNHSTRFFIDKYVQKTFMKINGEGSEAAAATRRVFRPADPVFVPPVNLPTEEKENFVGVRTQFSIEISFGKPRSALESEISKKSKPDALHFIVDRPAYAIIARGMWPYLELFIGRLNA